MINRRKKGSSLWRKPANLTEMKSSVNDVFDVADLKTVTKRISIISRLQQKTIRSNHHNYKTNSSNSYFKQDVCPKGNESKSMKRPQTSNTGKICSMNLAQKAYKVEKRINDKLIGENYHSENRDKKNNVAQGLLGEYSRYQQMSKEQLIQKLISLQYLANTIFKKNKFLEQKIKEVDPSFLQNN